jgi:DNA-binding NarL/FixJ family response regulator
MMLRGADGVELVGEATDGDEVPEAVTRHRPDVVLMDIRMPRVDGLQALAALRRQPGAPEVVVLTTFDADDQVVTAVRNGAAGFLLKDTPPPQIVEAIRRVADGEAVLDPSVTRGLLDLVAVTEGGAAVTERAAAARQALDALSERERDVAIAVSRGLANAQIAEELYVSPATVKAYVSRLLQRLGLDNRVQIALLVHDAGLTR